ERAVALLRDTELAITEIAAQTGWTSLGTFGRIFRDITGDSPGNVRDRERAGHAVAGVVPECHARAAQRPDLNMAVLEKRRRQAVANVDRT
ncbi:MAG: AraC family transcriptional regulator, partial [Stenotrophomonas maltophilia]